MLYYRNSSSYVMFSDFFFFQAEDGIRDLIVTGVQTCALPISKDARVPVTRTLGASGSLCRLPHFSADGFGHLLGADGGGIVAVGFHVVGDVFRSEERRVGKECRSRWSPYH